MGENQSKPAPRTNWHWADPDAAQLYDACASGDVRTVQRLLGRASPPLGAETLNRQHEFLRTALHAAAIAGHAKIVNILLADTRVDCGLEDADGERLLEACRSTQAADVVLTSQQAAAAVRPLCESGWGPLHFTALRTGTAEVRRVMYEGAASSAATADARGRTALHVACHAGNLAAARYLVEQAGAMVELADLNGTTPLMRACRGGHPAVVAWLLEAAGAQAGARDAAGRTAMHYAAEGGSVEVVRALGAAGVGVDTAAGASTGGPPAKKQGAAMLGHAASKSSQAGGGGAASPLTAACEHGHSEVVHVLVQEMGSGVGERDGRGRTPLVAAAEAGREGIVRWLAQAGADPLASAQDSAGTTALEAAARGDWPGTVRFLAREAACGVEAVNAENATPLMVACAHGAAAAARVLVEAGARVDQRSPGGCTVRNGDGGQALQTRDAATPMAIARIDGHAEAVRVLLQAGAPLWDEDGPENALRAACMKNHQELCKMLVRETNAIVDDSAIMGRQPLHIMVSSGLDVVRCLVEEGGADPNARERRNRTALSIAVSLGSFEVVRYLVEEAGAATEDTGWESLVQEAANEKDAEKVEYLLSAGCSAYSVSVDQCLGVCLPTCIARHSRSFLVSIYGEEVAEVLIRHMAAHPSGRGPCVVPRVDPQVAAQRRRAARARRAQRAASLDPKQQQQKQQKQQQQQQSAAPRQEGGLADRQEKAREKERVQHAQGQGADHTQFAGGSETLNPAIPARYVPRHM